MRELRYTLLSDGSSDAVLIPILSWLLDRNGIRCPIQPEWADLRLLPRPPKNLVERIEQSLRLYPCDLLLVHRDAENLTYDERKVEIVEALASTSQDCPPSICVVPVRMMEAWLLFDEAALRQASGNRAGRVPLLLPAVADLENLNDPKAKLHELLRVASELSGRRLQKLRIGHCARRVAEHIDDFAVLRGLPAFRELEADIRATMERERWASLS